MFNLDPNSPESQGVVDQAVAQVNDLHRVAASAFEIDTTSTTSGDRFVQADDGTRATTGAVQEGPAVILTVTVLLIRVAWLAPGRLVPPVHGDRPVLAARLFRRARTRRQLRHGPPPIVSWEWWHAAGGALAALAQVATPTEAARALRLVNPQPEVVVALHHLATGEGVTVDLAAWSLAVADALTQPAPIDEVASW